MKSFVKSWYSKNPFLFFLLPLSYVYQIFFFFHKLIYRLGIKKKFSSPIPVIVVGNITVGGTGKTPLTIELAKILQNAGYNPGIISRGYKGKARSYPLWVTKESDVNEIGDEPALIHHHTGCATVVSPKRSDAIKMLLQKTACNIILSDDGLQHHGLKKDLEIVLVDGQRKFGNGWCLPAGPLREPLRKLSHVDFIVYNDASNKHHYGMKFVPGEIYNLRNKDLKLSPSIQCTVHAVAAIGNPENFFDSLRELGFTIQTHIFPDHYIYKEADFSFCGDDEIVIMTEKDAVKCERFATPNFWVLPISANINEEFSAEFLEKVKGLSNKPEAAACKKY